MSDDTRDGAFGPDKLRRTPLQRLVQYLEERSLRIEHDRDWQTRETYLRYEETDGALTWATHDEHDIREVIAALDSLRERYHFEYLGEYERTGQDDTGSDATLETERYEGVLNLHLVVVAWTSHTDGAEVITLRICPTEDAYVALRAKISELTRRNAREDELNEASHDEWIDSQHKAQERFDVEKLLRAATTRVRDDFKAVARQAAYPSPTGSRQLLPGYSNEVPKASQIRAAFWARLHDPSSLCCELDWNVYMKTQKGIALLTEVELAGFVPAPSWLGTRTPSPPRLVLAVERLWDRVDGAKVTPMRTRVQARVAAMVEALRALADAGVRPSLPGVMLVGFGGNREELARLMYTASTGLDVDVEQVVSLWREEVPTLLTEELDCGSVSMRETFMQIDLLVLRDPADGSA
jgi:hypothetical protein